MALGACTATDVVIVLQKKRQRLESLEVICSGERAAEPPTVWTKLEIVYRLRGALVEKAVEHAIELSYTWVKQALQGAGLVARRKKRGSHRRRRPRRLMPGMLLHIDGSKHRWFCDDRHFDLLVILDDATSEIYYAQLVEEESTRTVMGALREVIETEGLFCVVQRSRQPFLRDPEGWGEGRSASAHANGSRDERARGADDSGLLAASAWPL